MIHARDIRTYVVSLPRRADRRARLAASIPANLRATYTSSWPQTFDGHLLDRQTLHERGVELFPWKTDSSNPWWSRNLKLGEIGCTLAHLACWRHAVENGDEPYVLILEDDADLPPEFIDRLAASLKQAEHNAPGFGLLYLGRFPLEPDQPLTPGLVRPGYSHCTFSYLVPRVALSLVLKADLERAVIPIDEFLPALYLDHPRRDVRTRFPRCLDALALDPPLVSQLPKDTWGSDTEDSAFVDWS